MAIEKDIINLLKGEGYKITDPVMEALTEFIDVIEEETNNFDEDENLDETEEID